MAVTHLRPLVGSVDASSHSWRSRPAVTRRINTTAPHKSSSTTWTVIESLTEVCHQDRHGETTALKARMRFLDHVESWGFSRPSLRRWIVLGSNSDGPSSILAPSPSMEWDCEEQTKSRYSVNTDLESTLSKVLDDIFYASHGQHIALQHEITCTIRPVQDNAMITSVAHSPGTGNRLHELHTVTPFCSLCSKEVDGMDTISPSSHFVFVQIEDDRHYLIWISHTQRSNGWHTHIALERLMSVHTLNSCSQAAAASEHQLGIIVSKEPSLEESRAFWTQELAGATAAAFPPRPLSTVNSDTKPRSNSNFDRLCHEIDLTAASIYPIGASAVIQAAWAFVLARYGDTKDICFGAILDQVPSVSRRDVATHGDKAIIPMRVLIEENEPISQFLADVSSKLARLQRQAGLGVENIAALSGEIEELCNFSSLLHIRIRTNTPDQTWPISDSNKDIGGPSCSLKVTAIVTESRVTMDFAYNTEILDHDQIKALSHHLEHVIRQLSELSHSPLENLAVAGDWDLQQAKAWQAEPTKINNSCLHDLISSSAQKHATKDAIYTSTRSITYSELEMFSDRVSRELRKHGVRRESRVPICFDKSCWSIVAILGILKAGGLYVPLDPSHPYERLQNLVSEVDADVMVVSAIFAQSCQGLTSSMVQVAPEWLYDQTAADDDGSPQDDEQLRALPSSGAYIIFSSGSTGKPKGMLIEHSAICTSLDAICQAWGFDDSMRMFQFSSIMFDACVLEIFATLITGGTLCLPSDAERLQETTNFVQTSQANVAVLTPSFARTLSPDQVPSLRQMILCGEGPTQDLLDTWYGRVELINGYGPSETCICATGYDYTSKQDSPTIIGSPIGHDCWIVEPDNHNKLAPIGCVGELVIQGHAMAREYINDPERTTQSFIAETDWQGHLTANSGQNANVGRLYKTGDLVKYRPNGQMQYIGRQDTQVKLRGQRIELAEIESSIKRTATFVEHVVVDVLRSQDYPRQTLAAFISLHEETGKSHQDGSRELNPPVPLLTMTNKLRSCFASLSENLKAILPNYMVPALFIPVSSMPSNASMKIDRKQLKQLGEDLSAEKLDTFTPASRDITQPTSEEELQLRELWAQVLDIPAETIRKHGDFLQLGGDSISMIRLVSLSHQHGFNLDMTAVFEDPRLSSLAAKRGAQHSFQGEPFDMVDPGTLQPLLDEVKQYCELPNLGVIEDVYPCTSLQEGLLALSVKSPGQYMTASTFRLPHGTDMDRFKSAWEETVLACPNLRTRIILHQDDESSVQAVIRDDFAWEDTNSLDAKSWAQKLKSIPLQSGSKLSRFAIVEESPGRHCFIWISHHSVVDGWSTKLITDTFESIYSQATPVEFPPFSNFVRYIQNIDREAAATFWTSQLEAAQTASFPRESSKTSPTAGSLQNVGIVSHNISLPPRDQLSSSITKASLIRAAWGLVLAKYCDTDDICFGTTESGRSAPVPGIEMMPGVTLATVPFRVRVDPGQTVSDFLHSVQGVTSQTMPYQQFGLQNIAKLSADTRKACDFKNLMVIQPAQQWESESSDALLASAGSRQLATSDDWENYMNYPLVLLPYLYHDRIELKIIFDHGVISEPEATALSQHLATVVEQLVAMGESPLDKLSLVGAWDIQHAINSHILMAASDSCTHWRIEKQLHMHPDAPAVSAWDADFTYAELGQCAKRLAHKLRLQGVGPESLVLFCFPKSAWAVVAMVAVEMAGGAFVPLDPAAPASRLQGILEDTKSTLAVSSSEYRNLMGDLGVPTIIVDSALIESLPDPKGSVASIVGSRNPSFVTFTSGSTGKPKGIVMTHGATTTTSDGYGAKLGVGPGSRVFQFSAYTFDMGVLDTLMTLMRGGCVCIPSDHDRVNNLAGVISRMEANWIFLTPTLADLLAPADVPSLRVMALGGEAISQKTLDRWKDSVEIHGLYGPAETSVCAWIPNIDTADKPANIGRPVSSAFWVVDPQDYTKLVPVGCIGELLIQGPMLARGYVQPDRQKGSGWIEDADWLPDCGQGSRKAYLSGDLVRRNADCTFEYVCRKDSQVKIHGQRVELGEIEAQIAKCLPSTLTCVVEFIKGDANSHDALVAFIWYTSGLEAAQPFNFLEAGHDGIESLVSTAERLLRQTLPPYMIPASYLAFQGQPETTTSGKVNRRSLVSFAKGATREEKLRYTPEVRQNELPTSLLELKLRDLWASVLKVESAVIGRGDHFLRLGGDSIAAIQLASLARRNNISLTVSSIFQSPILSDMAAAMQCDGLVDSFNTEPFGLLPATESRETFLKKLRESIELPIETIIEDAYPCTKTQEGFIAVAVQQPSSYIAKDVFRIPAKVDLSRFKSAWEETVKRCNNLRLRLAAVDGSFYQTVVQDDISWEQSPSGSLHHTIQALANLDIASGQRLCRYTIFRDNEADEHYFICVMHHAAFDGWTKRLNYETFTSLYRAQEAPRLNPYSRFVHYTQNLDTRATQDFWKTQLLGAKPTIFPRSAKATKAPRSAKLLKHSIDFPELFDTSVTRATILKAAWALLLARYCDADDVCFGATVSGRQAPVPGIESMAGPTVTPVPIRVRIDKTQSIIDFLSQIQTQASEMVAHEQYGIQNISKVCPEAREACDFSSMLAVQPADESSGGAMRDILAKPSADKFSVQDSVDGYFSFPLAIEMQLRSDGVDITFAYWADRHDEPQLRGLCHQFSHVIPKLHVANNTPLSEVSVAGPWDLEQAMRWNNVEMQPVDVCLHDLVSANSKANPSAEAIYSWEGSMTYGELDRLSDRLSLHLWSLGVRPETIVPVCFEKSVWVVVAMLGIAKAGGAFMALDPAHPVERRQALVQQCNAEVMVVSPSTAAACATMTRRVIKLSACLFTDLPPPLVNEIPADDRPCPKNSAYVLFTSGSTGTPKGVVIEHSAICTSFQGQAEMFGMSSTSRMMQFASYAFDACILETLAPLLVGGTTCIPSDTDRLQRTAGFIADAQVNLTMLTPSFARTLHPDQVPSLKTLIVGGEAPGQDIIDVWQPRVRLVNGYGPAEACICCSSRAVEYDDLPTNIGHGVSHSNWIVDPGNHDSLASVGCVGELLVGGPALARGYLNNEEKTNEAFVGEVAWMPQNLLSTRFYKTGDLVKYDSDGNMVYMGRKDTQVKLRGQRLELGEIEYQIKERLAGTQHAVVDKIERSGRESLVSFVEFEGDGLHDDTGMKVAPRPMSETLRKEVDELYEALSSALPSYAVPSHVIPIGRIPKQSSGKLDRQILHQLAMNMSDQELSAFAILQTGEHAFVECSTEVERTIREYWSSTLNIPADQISADDGFFHLGGDSIRIISLAKLVERDFGFSVGTALINSKTITIRTVAALIDGLCTQAPGDGGPSVDVRVEIGSLSRDVSVEGLSTHPARELPAQATVFVTGATGYLGTELLRQLLQSAGVGRVIALVRASSSEAGLKRIRKTAEIAQWWRDKYVSRLEVWTGDLAKDRLGLTEGQWKRLGGAETKDGSAIDAIIHNGAVVHWFADYDSLRKPNIHSTVDLLRIATSSTKAPKFVYVSGGIKTLPSDDPDEIADLLGKLNGYSQTKYVAEGVVRDVAGRLPQSQNRISAVKPGAIIGTAEHGVANIDDHVWRLVATAAGIQAYPKEADDAWYCAAGVDQVAEVILSQITLSDGVDAFQDIPIGVTSPRFWALVNEELPVACEPVSWDDWIERALAHMNEVGETHPLWPVQHFLGGMGVAGSRHGEAVDEKQRGRVEAAVKSNVRYLRRIGFIPSAAGEFGELQPGAVIRRGEGAKQI